VTPSLLLLLSLATAKEPSAKANVQGEEKADASPAIAAVDAPAEDPAPAAEPAPPADAPSDTVPPPPPIDAPPLFSFGTPAAGTAPVEGAAPPADGTAPPTAAAPGFSFQSGAPATTSPGDKPAAKGSITFGGIVQYDLRFRPDLKPAGTYYNNVPDLTSLSRNEVMAKFRWSAKLAKFGMKGDVDFYVRALPNTKVLADLSQYNVNSPFRFEMHDLYLYGTDMFGAKGLDIRVGQQKAMFGVGDQFNPTNNVNANDLEDVLLFGDQVGNLMARVDYSPVWNVMFTGILVPVFKPAMLPSTGYLAQTPDRYPFVSDELRWNLGAEQATGASLGYPTIVRDVNVQVPEFSAKNMQFFFRAGGSFGGQDIALSYYNGRTDIPQAIYNRTSQTQQPVCDPFDPTDCVSGVLASDVTLAFPKMQVAGLNLSGEMNPFGKIHKSFKSIGYRFELAVIFPEETRLRVVQDNVQFLGGLATKNGEYDYPGGDNRVVESTPFAKWTLGLDYQFNRFVYMNTQWVHGFVDEFGAGDYFHKGVAVRASDVSAAGDCEFDLASFSGKGKTCAREWLKPRLGDYLVWGTDYKWLQGALTLRVFTIWDLSGVSRSEYDANTGERTLKHYGLFTKEGFSAVIYPALMYNFGNGLEVQGGALLEFGKPWSKFGAPETGGHQIWLRMRYSY
jgi:hypothetical protein